MDKLRSIILQAGDLALKEQEKMTVENKSDGSIVTNGDLKVSQFLEQHLASLYPDHAIFSEENCSVLPAKNKVIVIDPIDGTESYSRKQDTWSILIGFLDGGRPVAGMIFQPTTSTLYFAQEGKGAFMEKDYLQTKLHAQGTLELKAVTSPKNYGEMDFLKNLHIQNIRPIYSAALKIMEVAKGEADIYPNFRNQCSIWDLVAPEIILKESGGKLVYENLIPLNFAHPKQDTRFCAVGLRKLNFKF